MSGQSQTPPPTATVADGEVQGLQVFEDAVASLAACLTDEDVELFAKLAAPLGPDTGSGPLASRPAALIRPTPRRPSAPGGGDR